jgi:hypothetical protein
MSNVNVAKCSLQFFMLRSMLLRRLSFTESSCALNSACNVAVVDETVADNVTNAELECGKLCS